MAKLQTIKGSGETDWLTGSYLHDDTIYGAGGKDFIFGYNKNDTLFGQGGEDRLFGGTGDDVLDGGEGADYLDGGAGTDEASYANAKSAITVRLDTGTGSRGEALDDKLVDIENVTGSAYDDFIYGNYLDNVLKGLDGEDHLFGYGGHDTLYGGRHSDTLDGGTGNDFLSGGSGNDFLWGGQNNDVLDGGSGIDTIHGEEGNDRIIANHKEADYIYGGSGIDTVDYREASVRSGTKPAGSIWVHSPRGVKVWAETRSSPLKTSGVRTARTPSRATLPRTCCTAGTETMFCWAEAAATNSTATRAMTPSS